MIITREGLFFQRVQSTKVSRNKFEFSAPSSAAVVSCLFIVTARLFAFALALLPDEIVKIGEFLQVNV
jgi:hypothetical protein